MCSHLHIKARMLLWQLNLDSVNLPDLFLSAVLLLRRPEARHFQGDVSDKDRETAGIHFSGMWKSDCQTTPSHRCLTSEGRSYCQCKRCPVDDPYDVQQKLWMQCENTADRVSLLLHFLHSSHNRRTERLRPWFIAWNESSGVVKTSQQYPQPVRKLLPVEPINLSNSYKKCVYLRSNSDLAQEFYSLFLSLLGCTWKYYWNTSKLEPKNNKHGSCICFASQDNICLQQLTCHPANSFPFPPDATSRWAR